jgi:N-acetylglucosaminyl-diphospho-decaprenol L-rhamnosyltransferase
VTLSILIVNYNVKYFLEQCLCSVKKAIEKLEAEVIVIDNNSSDGSADYLSPKFPWVKFILNTTNLGFSKANNLGISHVNSKYVLFLNPDTIVAEDSFEKCILFMESHARAGAMGVKMIDGSGKYLKESKRGFPSPWVSFSKLSGLEYLMPHSKLFGGYYLGHLNENATQLIDAISGAYMFVRKEALNKTGGFDEQFFMYAEDIDLSYRMQQSGYENYYVPETTIIHFKGESTHKDLKYITLFYSAMSLFVQKHFGARKSTVSLALIKSAIRIGGIFSVVGNFWRPKKQRTRLYCQNIFLAGEENSKQELAELLTKQRLRLSPNEQAADAIIFCEGERFSFKEIIEAISKSRKKYYNIFHAWGSKSVVGSDNKKMGGLSVGLYP